MRIRRTMKPDTEAYRALVSSYYQPRHYSKAALASPRERLRDEALLHLGMSGQALLAGAGKFRIHALRDGWIDFRAFQKTAHYDLYYRRQGLTDRIHVAFPVATHAESAFLIDRTEGRFTPRHLAVTEMAMRGIREFHRRLFLDHGLPVSNTPLTPLQRQIVRGLLSGKSEKEIATAMGQKPTTLHTYIKALYTRFGVNGRAGLTALWFGKSV